ncbi:MAG: PAS domain S-box protein [Anaerolineae bacterium]
MNTKPKILIVDDEEDLREFITTILDPQTYDLVTAASGEDALILLENDPYLDVILMDVMMPGLDGFEVLEILKANPQTEPIKVIMLTALNRVDEKVRAFAGGAADFVVKPFEKEELLARLETQVRLKQAEEKLVEERNLLRQLIDNIPDFIFIKDTQSRFVINNLAHMRALRATHQNELIGQTDFDIFPPELATRYHADEAEIIRSGMPLVNIEEPYLDESGNYRDLSTTKVPLRDSAGNIVGLVGISRDITAHQQAERALLESEERYRVLAENVSDLIAKLTCDGIYSYVSPACRPILGYEPEEMMGRSYYDFIHPEDLAEIKAMNSSVLDPANSSTFAVRFLRQDDTYIWLESSVRGFYNPGTHTTELVVVARDVTERKRYEEALEKAYTEMEKRVEERTKALSKSNELLKYEVNERKRAEIALEKERATLARRVEERTTELSAANAELLRASRLKDEFLASMSHELRTPLNAILGMSEVLQEQAYGPLNEKQMKAVHSIDEGGRHLLALINDILDLSKIEAGKFQLEINPVSLEDVCQASLRFVKQIALKKRIRISSAFDAYGAERIQADERRLKQVLVNLINQCRKIYAGRWSGWIRSPQ